MLNEKKNIQTFFIDIFFSHLILMMYLEHSDVHRVWMNKYLFILFAYL